MLIITLTILYIIDYILGGFIPEKSIFYEVQNKKYKHIFTIIMISAVCCSFYKERFEIFWFIYFCLRIIDKLLYLVNKKLGKSI